MPKTTRKQLFNDYQGPLNLTYALTLAQFYKCTLEIQTVENDTYKKNIINADGNEKVSLFLKDEHYYNIEKIELWFWLKNYGVNCYLK